jgi:hypothetical protein
MMEKPFLKIRMHSGPSLNGLGLGHTDIAVVVYYEMNENVQEPTDVLAYLSLDELDAIENWVNTSDKFVKNAAGDDFIIYSKKGFELVYLEDKQVKQIKEAGHLFSK